MQIIRNKYAFSNIVVDFTCCCFILLFVYAATSKLIDYQKFQIQIGQSPLLSPFSGWLVWIIPSLEIGISVMLFLQKFRNMGLYAAFTLMVLFTVYIFTIIHYSDYVPCSCGGILEHMNWDQHFLFNLLFIVLAIVGVLANESMLKTSKLLSINNIRH